MPEIQKKVSYSNFKTWLKENYKTLIFLIFLVCLSYFNSLGNNFVSDDIPAISKNDEINKPIYFLKHPLAFIQPLFYFTIHKFFGDAPVYYRMLNYFFHTGTVLIIYLLLSLLSNPKIALFSAALFAVHPIQTESVTWISGGPSPQYSFFLLLTLLLYTLSHKNKRLFYLSIFSFIISIISKENAVVFPLVLITSIFCFDVIPKNYKKTIPFFIIGALYAFILLGRIPQRIADLNIISYQKPQDQNPFIQIPIAITSYLELIFWPKNLTLYHSEMFFTKAEYILRLLVFIVFLGIIIYSYKRNRVIFFWLSFFIITLLPTLTPFGISWIVAERYVYLGSLGIFVVVSLAIQKLGEFKNMKKISYIIFSCIIISLIIRTIIRNIDWRNEDNLWIATAKTSPSSPNTHNNMGDVYGRHGDLKNAVREFQKAIEINPNYADAYHNLANTYQEIGKAQQAIENYKKAISINPNLWQSYVNLSGIYLQKGELELAQNYLSGALKIRPDDIALQKIFYYIQLQIKKAAHS